MLGKLIKYDLRFGVKQYAFMAALTAALLIVSTIAMIFNNQIVTALFVMLAVIATIAYAIVYIVVSVQHLAKQLCSRESYLNYSLPVTAHSLILSKLLTVLFWGVVTSAVIILFWIVAVNGMVLAQNGMSLGSFWNDFTEMVRSEVGFEISTMIFMALLMGVIQFVMTVCLAVFCVTLANVPYLKERNWGVAAGVCGFIVLYNIVSLVPVFIWWPIEKAGGADVFSNTAVTGAQANGMMSELTIISGIAYAVFAAVFYFLSVYTAEKHRFIG